MTPKAKSTLSGIVLIGVAMIWGLAYVAQSVGSNHVGAFTFLTCRSIIAGMALLPVIAFRNRKKNAPSSPAARKNVIIGGVLCGAALAAASVFQQSGIALTSTGKAGFITALYMIIVPVLGLFFGRKVPLAIWFGVVLASVGLYLSCMGNEGFQLTTGDLYVLICAFFYSVHILIIDHYSPMVDGVVMSCIQFFSCSAISAVFMMIMEKPAMEDIMAAGVAILYAGLMSSAVGYTLQIIAQAHVAPAVASLIMSTESMFALLSGWILLNQSLTKRELIGCALMFAAILLSQIPESKAKK